VARARGRRAQPARYRRSRPARAPTRPPPSPSLLAYGASRDRTSSGCGSSTRHTAPMRKSRRC
jgi:hypothetical protein